jgi:hypothetical protein
VCDDRGGEGYMPPDRIFELDRHYLLKLLQITEKLSIYANPGEISNPLLLGHMCNDSANIEIKHSTEQEIKNGICRYILLSNNNAVIKYHSSISYILATKDINKGDEITVSYTPGFWLTNDEFNIFKKIMNEDPKFKDFVKASFITIFLNNHELLSSRKISFER